MEVSIITPAKRLDNYALETIKSVASQITDFSYEHIVIVDDKNEVLPQNYFSKNYSIIYLKSKRKSGPSSSRNEGIEIAKGNIICFIDADDLWDLKYLRKLKVLYDSCEDIGAVSVGGFTFGKNIKKQKKITAWHREGFLSINVLSWNIIGCPSGFSFRSKYKNHAIFNEDLRWCEDYLFYLSLKIKTNLNIYRSNDIFFWYRISDSQVTYKPNIKMLEESKEIINKILYRDLKKYLKIKNFLSLRLQLNRSFKKASRKHYFLHTIILCLLSPTWLASTIIKNFQKHK